MKEDPHVEFSYKSSFIDARRIIRDIQGQDIFHGFIRQVQNFCETNYVGKLTIRDFINEIKKWYLDISTQHKKLC